MGGKGVAKNSMSKTEENNATRRSPGRLKLALHHMSSKGGIHHHCHIFNAYERRGNVQPTRDCGRDAHTSKRSHLKRELFFPVAGCMDSVVARVDGGKEVDKLSSCARLVVINVKKEGNMCINKPLGRTNCGWEGDPQCPNVPKAVAFRDSMWPVNVREVINYLAKVHNYLAKEPMELRV